MTHYRVLRRFPEITLVELCLQTGRTHQIRVHLSYIGHPVIGDPEYRRNATPYLQRLEQKHTRIAAAIRRINRQMLHAQALSFQHPRDKRTITLTAPLPHDFASLVQLLEASFR